VEALEGRLAPAGVAVPAGLPGLATDAGGRSDSQVVFLESNVAGYPVLRAKKITVRRKSGGPAAGGCRRRA
jgi:hypothetical protein